MDRHLKWMCREVRDWGQGRATAAGTFSIGLGAQYVCGFAFSGSHVALVTKAKPGKAERGEEAMIREFKEETGADCTSWQYYAKGTHIQFFRAELATMHPVEGCPKSRCDGGPYRTC